MQKLLIGVAVLLSTVLIFLTINGTLAQEVRSAYLSHKVAEVQGGKYSCPQGLKKLNINAAQFSPSNTHYTRGAQESALNYILSCTFVAGNTKQALAYAQQLRAFYVQSSATNTNQLQKFDNLIQYMKSYR